MTDSVDEAIDEFLSFLKGYQQLNIISARQSVVDCIALMIWSLQSRIKVLKEAEEGLEKAKAVARVADVKALGTVLDAVKNIWEALQRV